MASRDFTVACKWSRAVFDFEDRIEMPYQQELLPDAALAPKQMTRPI